MTAGLLIVVYSNFLCHNPGFDNLEVLKGKLLNISVLNDDGILVRRLPKQQW